MQSFLTLILVFGVLNISQSIVETISNENYKLGSLLSQTQQDSKFRKYGQKYNVHHLMQFPNSKTQTCKCSFDKSTCPKREFFKTDLIYIR